MRAFAAILLAFSCISLPFSEAAEYIADGVLNDTEEAIRWLANRARHAPLKEKQRVAITNNVPAGPLPPVSPNSMITTASRRHSEDLAVTGYFQHPSPTGTLYYVANYSPGQRMSQEGYSWYTYAENIAAGYESALAVHNGWWTSNGHRNNMLNSSRREIGVGYILDYGSDYWRYYTQNFASTWNGKHFFTGSVFHDANGNDTYDEGEGVANIEVQLRRANGSLHTEWDRSTASGNFSVPIEAITNGEAVQVELLNQTGSAQTVSVSIDYWTVVEIALGIGERYVMGSFEQPAGETNVGFRNLDIPTPSAEMSMIAGPTGPEAHVELPTLEGATYSLECSYDLQTWEKVETKVAGSALTSFTDGGELPGGGQAGFCVYRVVLERD